MSSAKPMSSSCQSIAKESIKTATSGPDFTATSSNSVGSLIATSCLAIGYGQQTHYVNGTGSLGRLKYHHKHKSLDASDEELEYAQLSQSTHILGRYKSNRFLASKPEDRRRRTIIVEKKNDSYGFTLQSYGIHYKRDEELEMITYVDYVEYGGPAYRAGMREGDVILSINGSDMEKAEHKTIVEFIKQCDSRMRMVVLFDDCVRKVDLHMRYIQLQSLLQSKMNELERVCLRERELMEGKWKTHSLPARKKANPDNSASDGEVMSPPETTDGTGLGYYRTTLSTEDVTSMSVRQQTLQPEMHSQSATASIIPPPAQFMLAYHYLDPTYRYVLRPTHAGVEGFSDCSDLGLMRNTTDLQQQGFVLQRTDSVGTTQCNKQLRSCASKATGKPPAPPPRTCEKHKPPTKQEVQQVRKHAKSEKSSRKHCRSGHSCNPCLGHFRWKSTEKSAAVAAATGNGDNISLDAYDLASPCCDTHCVPTRRRHRQHKEHSHKHREREHADSKDRQATVRPKLHTHVSPNLTGSRHRQNTHNHEQHQHHHHHHQQSQAGSIRSRYFDLASGLASHCSLHSCTSSDFAPADSASYSTSISTDTLFWDPKSETTQSSRQHSTKSRQSYVQQQTPQSHQHHGGVCEQRYHVTAIQPSQVYPHTIAYVQKPKSWDNLGFSYLDTVAVKPQYKMHISQQRHSMPRRNPLVRHCYSTYGDVENYAPPPTEFVGELTTTTTTTITTKSTEELVAACDCLTPQQQQALKAAQYQLSQSQKLSHQNSCQMGYYSHLPRPTTDVGTSTGQQAPPNDKAD